MVVTGLTTFSVDRVVTPYLVVLEMTVCTAKVHRMMMLSEQTISMVVREMTLFSVVKVEIVSLEVKERITSLVPVRVALTLLGITTNGILVMTMTRSTVVPVMTSL